MTMIIKTRRKAPNMSINKQSNTRSAWRPISSCHSHHYSVSGTCMRLHFEECDGAVGVTSMIVYSDIYIYIYMHAYGLVVHVLYPVLDDRPSVRLSVCPCVCVCVSVVCYLQRSAWGESKIIAITMISWGDSVADVRSLTTRSLGSKRPEVTHDGNEWSP